MQIVTESNSIWGETKQTGHYMRCNHTCNAGPGASPGRHVGETEDREKGNDDTGKSARAATPGQGLRAGAQGRRELRAGASGQVLRAGASGQKEAQGRCSGQGPQGWRELRAGASGQVLRAGTERRASGQEGAQGRSPRAGFPSRVGYGKTSATQGDPGWCGSQTRPCAGSLWPGSRRVGPGLASSQMSWREGINPRHMGFSCYTVFPGYTYLQ